MNLHLDAETNRFLTQLRAVPALDAEQELLLARAFLERGDEGAAERLVTANLRHVLPMALRYRHLGAPLSDLIAQGTLGLLKALRRFDPSRGLRFVTYANHWMRSEMLALVLESRHMVGGGRGDLRSAFAFRMRREHAQLSLHVGDEGAVVSELAQRYGKTDETVARILANVEQRDASLDAQVSADGGATLLDQLSGDEPAADARLAASAAAPELASAIETAKRALSERERYIVEHRLMADEDSQLSLREIGEHFGVTRERARQIEERLKQKLRQKLASVAQTHELSFAA
jgi:RNA polymerase sigma-32 factor